MKIHIISFHTRHEFFRKDFYLPNVVYSEYCIKWHFLLNQNLEYDIYIKKKLLRIIID